MLFSSLLALAAYSISIAFAFNSFSFDEAPKGPQTFNTSPSLQVDLGYSVYEGYHNTTDGLNQWKSIRYAEPPLGKLRWQLPQPPVLNRSVVIQANLTSNVCPQQLLNSYYSYAGDPVEYLKEHPGSEDCLFLNVVAPPNAENLPVLVWIHPGGYGMGNAQVDLGNLINTNNNSFIGVTIQYRLGAFGFLSSDEVNRFGVVNAGLRDQTFALQWVQNNTHLFGGNASHVTIAGESSAGNSVMLQAMAYGGTLGTTLFKNVSGPKSLFKQL